MRSIILVTLMLVGAWARFEAKPVEACQAYNNMKHTKNTHNVVLDTSRAYTVLKHHKGQNLVLIKGEQPAQRWVDDSCFRKESPGAALPESNSRKIRIEDEIDRATKSIENTKHTKKYENKISGKQNLLALTWHNAFCETHRYKKECKQPFLTKPKQYSTQHFVLHGLWPQPNNRLYCNVDKALVSADKHKRWRDLPCLALDEKTENRLAKVMPGYLSELHKHEWVKHGTCYGTDAETYFRDAISFVEQLNASKVAQYFKKHIGKRVTLQQIRQQFDRSFGKGAGKRVELVCKKGLVTELRLQLGSGSDDLGTLLHRGKTRRSRCHSGILDRAGFAKETGARAGFTKETGAKAGFGR